MHVVQLGLTFRVDKGWERYNGHIRTPEIRSHDVTKTARRWHSFPSITWPVHLPARDFAQSSRECHGLGVLCFSLSLTCPRPSFSNLHPTTWSTSCSYHTTPHPQRHGRQLSPRVWHIRHALQLLPERKRTTPLALRQTVCFFAAIERGRQV